MHRFALLPLLILCAAPRVVAAVDPIRAEFEALCAEQRAGDDGYFGDAVVEQLRERLAQHDRGLTDQNLLIQVGVRGRLGRELRRLGRLDEAIAVLGEARRLARAEPTLEPLLLEVTRDLALTHLLLAEDENCVAHQGAASCKLPIAPGAVHAEAANTRRAAELFEDYLAARPDNLEVRWLADFSRRTAGDTPHAPAIAHPLPEGALASDVAFPAWRDIAPELGVNSFDLAGGAVMDDFDGDGLLDLITSTWDPCDHMKAFRNDGLGGFEDVSRAWGLDAQFGGLNLVHGDYDGDGRLDLFVLRGAWRGRHGEVRNSLLRNTLGEGDGDHGEDRFVDVTRQAGVLSKRPTQTAAWQDFDGDGDLDLYVGNESGQGRVYPSELWRNDGPDVDGATRFTDIAAISGVDNLRYAKAVAWGDFDDDGDADLYVSNIGPNRLYRNDGPGSLGADGAPIWRFVDVAPEVGVVEPSGSSFASWFFDFDNDGDLDLFVADYGSDYERVFASYFGVPSSGGQPRLYRNANGRFEEISRAVGLDRPALPMGANYGDLDNDGFADIYLGTGIPNLEAVMPNLMYRSDGGRRFLDITAVGGFGHVQKGHGVAFGDLDNDGDQDLFEQMGGAYPVDAFYNALYENPGAPDMHWITLRLEGRRANRFGLGARIEVRTRQADGSGRSIHALVGAGGSFGASSLQQEIGLGRAASIEQIVVRWPGPQGERQSFAEVEPDRIYRVVEGGEALERVDLPRIRLGGEHAGHAPSAVTGRSLPTSELVRSGPSPPRSETPRADAPLTPEAETALAAQLAPVRRAVDAEPRALEPRIREIALLFEAGRYAAAHSAATAAIQALPMAVEPPYLRGVVGMARGALGDAEMDFRRALTLAPRHVPALSNLAVVVAARGATGEAIDLLERVLELAPGDANARQNLQRLREEKSP